MCGGNWKHRGDIEILLHATFLSGRIETIVLWRGYSAWPKLLIIQRVEQAALRAVWWPESYILFLVTGMAKVTHLLYLTMLHIVPFYMIQITVRTIGYEIWEVKWNRHVRWDQLWFVSRKPKLKIVKNTFWNSSPQSCVSLFTGNKKGNEERPSLQQSSRKAQARHSQWKCFAVIWNYSEKQQERYGKGEGAPAPAHTHTHISWRHFIFGCLLSTYTWIQAHTQQVTI